MRSEYNLKPMKKEDWERLHELEKEIFEDDLFTEEQFIDRIEKGNFFALDIDGKIVGELAVERFGEDGAHLGRIGVARSHQRQGLGTYLMECAINWFKNEKNITTVHLYTQDHNVAAQSLYKKFGFDVSGTTWHYFVPFAGLEPQGKYSCQEIQDDEIVAVSEMYPTLPAVVIRRCIQSNKCHALAFKNSGGMIVGAARFTPSFPGAFPFEIEDVNYFDDFISGMQKFSLPEFDYVRTVFTDNEDLAEVCESRGYHLHHRLFKMSLHL